MTELPAMEIRGGARFGSSRNPGDNEDEALRYLDQTRGLLTLYLPLKERLVVVVQFGVPVGPRTNLQACWCALCPRSRPLVRMTEWNTLPLGVLMFSAFTHPATCGAKMVGTDHHELAVLISNLLDRLKVLGTARERREPRLPDALAKRRRTRVSFLRHRGRSCTHSR